MSLIHKYVCAEYFVVKNVASFCPEELQILFGNLKHILLTVICSKNF